MTDIVHKKIKQVEVICEDGSLYTITGVGTLHVNDSEIKGDKGKSTTPIRQAAVSMRVDSEKETNGG